MRTPRENPQLLVSVRNAHEAAAVVAGAADWVDVKEPLRGPLGMSSPEAIADVVQIVGGRRPVSAALGELDQLARDCGELKRALWGVCRVKIGLSNCTGIDWQQKLFRIRQMLSAGVKLVAVHYADWASCGAPQPAALLEAAEQLECPAVLLDTYDKSRGNLLSHLSPGQLADFATATHARGMDLVAAGGLRLRNIGVVLQAGVDVVGVRSAACRRNCRTAGISPRRLAALRRLMVQGFSQNFLTS